MGPHSGVMISLRFLFLSVIATALILSPAAASTRPATPPVTPLTVVHGFDPPTVAWSAGHRGVDLVGRPGQVVSSPLPGVVRFAGVVAGKPTVSIDHGAFITTYEPVVAWVKRGDQVSGGQALGALQTTNGHCFPVTCLHWGLIIDDEYANPLSLLDDPRVRLLPTRPVPSWTWFTPADGPVGRRSEVAPW